LPFDLFSFFSKHLLWVFNTVYLTFKFHYLTLPLFDSLFVNLEPLVSLRNLVIHTGELLHLHLELLAQFGYGGASFLILAFVFRNEADRGHYSGLEALHDLGLSGGDSSLV